MNRSDPEVAIVGGGLAGLACALKVADHGFKPLVLEKSNEIGGRVRTEAVEGFLIDLGFQVYLSAYPEAGKLLNLESLELQHFSPGALLFKKDRLYRVMDVFREPGHLLASALAPIGTIKDKLLVAELKRRLHKKSAQAIADAEDLSTEAWLRQFGFSDRIIDDFFRSFYGGIFLERELSTSSQMFEFTFGMFSRGSACLPAGGMQEIPRQLAGRLSSDAVQIGAGVTSIEGQTLVLEDGSKVRARQVVVATDGSTASNLIDSIKAPQSWRSVTGINYAAPRSPLSEPIIALNGSGKGIVNSVAVLSDVAPGYSPDGRAMVSVSILGDASQEKLEDVVREELAAWFGDTSEWEHLRTDSIRHALPGQSPGGKVFESPGYQEFDDVVVCGDHCTSASIEGAIVSGQKAGERVVAKLLEQSR